MTVNRKIVQLSLITIGTCLILATYFVFPTIKEKKLLEKNIVKDEVVKTDDVTRNTFFDVTYRGENENNTFTVHSDKAEIKEDTNIVFMNNMLITIVLRDSKWIIECTAGKYNKLNYNIFCSEDVKASDGKTKIYSQNLELLNDDSATVYNNVLIIDEHKSSLYADRVNFNFETKLYHINMFNKDESVKVKLIE